MFKKADKDPSPIDAAIAQVVDDMLLTPTGTKEYTELTEQLERLYKSKGHVSDRSISPDTLLMVGANLLGIILILTYERANVVTSKALSFILRLKP